MSDPVASALERAKSRRAPTTTPKEASSGDAVADALARAKKRKEQPLPAIQNPTLGAGMDAAANVIPGGAAGAGAAETAANLITGSVASIPAAGASLYKLATAPWGLKAREASDASAKVQEALTYQPRTEAGQRMSGAINTVLSIPARVGDAAAEKIAEKTGSKTLAAAADVAIQAVPALLGAKGAQKGGRMLDSAPEAPTAIFKDSAGARAAAPDLSRASPELQAEIQKQAYRGGVSREALERQLVADRLPVRMKLTKGMATQDVVQLSHEMNRRGKDPELAQTFNQINQQLIDNLDEVRAQAAPNAVGNDFIQNGQALVDAYKTADVPIREAITARYKELEAANGGQFPVDGVAFVQAADAALSKKMKGRYVPKEVAGDLAELRDGGPMTFENFENLRTNLAAEARKADRSGDGNAAAAVNIVREALETLPMSAETAAIKPLADAARAAAKARFDRLREDPAYRAAVDDTAEIGELSPLADSFVQKYVVKGKAAHIRAMRENLAADPVAGETISAGALNYLKAKAGIDAFTNEGNFSQAGYNKALAEITPRMEFLLDEPTAQLARDIGDVARWSQAQPRGSFVNNSNTFTAAAAEHAANAAEGMANVAAHGFPIGTIVRKKVEARADKKFVQESTKPGAGIALSELAKKK